MILKKIVCKVADMIRPPLSMMFVQLSVFFSVFFSIPLVSDMKRSASLCCFLLGMPACIESYMISKLNNSYLCYEFTYI